MTKKVTPTRTLNPLHFEDFEPHRFEDLVRQLAYEYRNWATIEATGRLGGDDGVDVRATELVFLNPLQAQVIGDDTEEFQQVDEHVWVIQCKRYQTVTPSLIRKTVSEAIPDGSDPVYGLIIAIACDVTKKTYDTFRQAAREKGVQEYDLWTKARLEDLMFQPRYDRLLFAYFGISLVMQKKSKLYSVRQTLAIKRKLRKVFEVEDNHGNPKPFLVRNIDDETYPVRGEIPDFNSRLTSPWQLVQFIYMSVHGLLVAHTEKVGWVRPDETWDLAEDSPNQLYHQLHMDVHAQFVDEQPQWDKLDKLKAHVPADEQTSILVARFLPYSSVLEVDPDGDNAYSVPHLYCSFDNELGPFHAGVRYFHSPKYQGLTELDPSKRVKLFAKYL